MSATPRRFSQFRADIRKLVDEIEKHVRPHRGSPIMDRELGFQYEAFAERCDQAQRLQAEIADDAQSYWHLRSGDAKRIEESLRLSLDYFRASRQR